MLCKTCQNITFSPIGETGSKRQFLEKKLSKMKPEERLFYFHLPSFSALQASAQNNCHLCTLIVNGLLYERFRPRFVIEKEDQVFLFISAECTEMLNCQVEVRSGQKLFQFYLYELQG